MKLTPVNQLIQLALARLSAATAVEPVEACRQFSLLLQQVDPARRQSLPALDAPGRRHFTQAIVVTGAGQHSAWLAALAALEPVLPWSPFYGKDNWTQTFLDDFAAAEIIGPDGLIPSNELIMGLFVLGPNVFYPAHAHPAVELYWILNGRPEFQMGAGAAWTVKPAGALVLHPSEISHAIRTGPAPLLALYFWRGDIMGRSWYRHNMADESEPKKYPPMLGARA